MIAIGIAKYQPYLALALGVLAVVVPRFLNYLVAIWLIVVGVTGLGLVR